MWGDQRGSSEESLKSKVACSNLSVDYGTKISGITNIPAVKHAP